MRLLILQWTSVIITAQIRGFLASLSSRSSCPFDPLGSIGPVVGPLGLVSALYSAGSYTGLAGPVFESYARLPRLGLSGMHNHWRVSNGMTTAGVSAKASNHSPSGCSGMISGARAVTGEQKSLGVQLALVLVAVRRNKR